LKTEVSFRERIAPEELAGEAQDHLARYAFAAHWAPGRRVADICCGVGYGANLLAAAGAAEVYAVDLSSEAIQEARQRYGGRAIEFVCADATSNVSLPPVDVVVCFEGIEHVEAPERLMENIVRSLDSHGVALLSTPNAACHEMGHSGNPYHEREFKRNEFERLLRQYFDEIDMYFQWGFDTPHDAEWGFMSLLRLITPVRVKQRARWLVSKGARDTGRSISPRRLGSGVRYRPYPATYLSAPGLRMEPQTWVAVCETPRKRIDVPTRPNSIR
jgi:2-polyprenyl-3-methyl-5-hydroxy-6-metoxy-1,4-benzoquinol methylase